MIRRDDKDSCMLKPKPMILIILDGWGYSENQQHNAIAAAKTPVWNALVNGAVHTLIQGSEGYVGLPQGQMGNSEVGHLNLGAGRIVHQDFTRISRDVDAGKFGRVENISKIFNKIKERNGSLHVFGLLSDGGVHSHQEHIFAAIKVAADAGLKKIFLHAFLDGRDTPPKSAEQYLRAAQKVFEEVGVGQIASVCGRYYAMDRDQRWSRIEKVYKMLTQGEASFQAQSPHIALTQAYERGETDEFVQPTLITGTTGEVSFVQDGDGILFMNFRADRARQLTCSFVEENFDGFPRERRPQLVEFVCLTEYQQGLPCPVAYSAVKLPNVLGQVLADAKLKQLRIAETEKYAHVTFFFNGGEETPFVGEERILIPSPKVATYDLQPEMSANLVTDELVAAISDQQFDVIICNFANPDMVGHTGNFKAAIKAIETVDSCLGRIIDAARQYGGEVIITADHGNVEKMQDSVSGQPHTAHTTEPVPFVYVGRPAEVVHQGALQDVAPTILYLLGLPIPNEMTGRPIVKLRTNATANTATGH